MWATASTPAHVGAGNRRLALAELLVFPTTLSTTQRSSLQQYLLLRWGSSLVPSTVTPPVARSLPESIFWVPSYPVRWDASEAGSALTAGGVAIPAAGSSAILAKWLAATDGASRAAAVAQTDNNWNPSDTENAQPGWVVMADGRWGIRSPHNYKMTVDGAFGVLNRLVTLVFTGKWGEGILTKAGGASIWLGNGRYGSQWWGSAGIGVLMFFSSGLEMYSVKPNLNQRYVLLYQAILSADGGTLTFWSMFRRSVSPSSAHTAPFREG